MKKFPFILSLISVLILASCSNNIPSSGDDSLTSSSISTSEVIPTDWTDNEKTIMREHLANYVLPFVSVPRYSLVYDEEYEHIVIESGVASTGSDASYANLLETNNYSVSHEDYYGNTRYLATLAIENGKRISLQMLQIDLDLTIYASLNIPLTSWPSGGINEYFTNHSLSVNDNIPSFSATYYFASDLYSIYSCYQIEVPYQGSVGSTEDAYTLSLTSSGYSINRNSYDSQGIIALAPNKTIKIKYYYINSSFYINIYHVDKWPTSTISSFLGASVTETVPQFAWDSGFTIGTYPASEDGPAFVYIAVDDLTGNNENEKIAQTETIYNQSFTNNKWVIDSSSYDTKGYYADSPLEQINVQHFYDAFYDVYRIFISRGSEITPWTSSISWPTEHITSVLPTGAATVPNYNGTASYYGYLDKTISSEEKGTTIRVRVSDMDEAKIVYTSTLNETGWIYNSVGDIYFSSDNSVKISLATSQPSSAGYQYLLITILNVYHTQEGTFNMSISAQRIYCSAEKAIYLSGHATMYIEKNGSLTDVGGDPKDGFYLPDEDGYSRLYPTQKLTFDVGDDYVISTIEITHNGKKGGSSAITNGRITGGSATSSENTVTITANTGISLLSVILSSQIQVSEIIVTFARKS